MAFSEFTFGDVASWLYGNIPKGLNLVYCFTSNRMFEDQSRIRNPTPRFVANMVAEAVSLVVEGKETFVEDTGMTEYRFPEGTQT